eukprot:13205-Rhodomonas_salina.1
MAGNSGIKNAVVFSSLPVTRSGRFNAGCVQVRASGPGFGPGYRFPGFPGTGMPTATTSTGTVTQAIMMPACHDGQHEHAYTTALSAGELRRTGHTDSQWRPHRASSWFTAFLGTLTPTSLDLQSLLVQNKLRSRAASSSRRKPKLECSNTAGSENNKSKLAAPVLELRSGSQVTRLRNSKSDLGWLRGETHTASSSNGAGTVGGCTAATRVLRSFPDLAPREH